MTTIKEQKPNERRLDVNDFKEKFKVLKARMGHTSTLSLCDAINKAYPQFDIDRGQIDQQVRTKRMNPTYWEALATYCGFDPSRAELRTCSAVVFKEFLGEDVVDLRCDRSSGRPASRARDLVTVQMEDTRRNINSLPWPLDVGLTFGSDNGINDLLIHIKEGRLRFRFRPGSKTNAGLPGSRKAYPDGDLEIEPEGRRITIQPTGDAFEPDWIFRTPYGPAGALTAKHLILLYDLVAGDTVEVTFAIYPKGWETSRKAELEQTDKSQKKGALGRQIGWVAEEKIKPSKAREAIINRMASVAVEELYGFDAAGDELIIAGDRLEFVAVESHDELEE